ncbi:MAG: D-alanyl-D-alanine carboxypeptidase family protein [Acidimicrobiales bacterium]
MTGPTRAAMLEARRRSPSARRRATRRRLRLLRTAAALGLLGLLVVWLAVSGGGAARRPQLRLRVTLPPLTTVGGAVATAGAPVLPWPTTGEAAVDVPAVGYRAQSGREEPVPVASLTKIMTAYVVLEDHPLAPGSMGPRVEVTAGDAHQFGVDATTDQSNVLLKAGETLTEHQLLEGLLVHSANDFAYSLAVWDAGSLDAFVARMNATALTLGMRHTHFADPSGYSPSSQSTAADLLRVASAAMSKPVFSQIVAMTSATLPLAGTVESYTPLVGATGVVGVKSGFTTAAGGGDVLAYRTSVDGQSFVALAAVTSQRTWTVLDFAGKAALALAKSAAARVQTATVAAKGTVVAQLRRGGRTISLTTASAVRLLTLEGARVRQLVHIRVPRPGAKRGTQVGNADFVLAGQHVSVPVRAAARVP